MASGSMHVRTGSLNGRSVRNPNHVRQPSDIDSLSPEVVAALQSTFGGRLSELRSLNSLPKRTEPEPSPLKPPVIEEWDEEEDSDREGKYLVASYVTGILISVIILFTAGRGNNEDAACGGGVESSCVRLYGYILPIGVSGISLLVALVLSVFDVAFGVYNVLSTTEKYFLQADLRLSDIPQVVMAYTMDVGFVSVAMSLLWMARATTVDPMFTLCYEGLKVYWTFGLILMGAVIFWCAVQSVRDPESTHQFMKRAARVVLALLLVFALSSAVYYALAPAHPRPPCPDPDAAPANATGEAPPLQLYPGWWWEPEPPKPAAQPLQLFLPAPAVDRAQCPARQSLPQCRPREEDDRGMCEARYDGGTCEPRPEQGMCEARYEEEDRGMCEARYDEEDRGMCEARYDERGSCEPRAEEGVCAPRHNEMCEPRNSPECEWPWLKQVQVYERGDKCRYDYPQCDWPLIKRVQVYESELVCKYSCPSCDWPLVKRIQVYSRADRCGTLTHPECDWPHLKQIQRYEAKGRCLRGDRPHCDWPFLKQILSYEPWDLCSALHHRECVAHEGNESSCAAA
ncbi:hypothetical protein MPTK1_3g13690 [Marchantia polymorpha subsp. ruderalis]|uniref:Uncharacterized protein n=2 Tax=Marchantia polymorpha TaxID=3197 RepID=A0AAF6B0H2_MARPO|nr:hypothetical protein MARPO_0004s0302 [Marchantia polymorpha]BBN05506.1 hypothetical protein Mp_3g13690 [Marchantia polymorpha subsp. ruderalis]|eukprot:PTQ49079.1 hypothetical protein MARPO_0004s0302 [Marchantia polymorpha]